MLHHHERWDGRGYPSGMAGDEIPLEARMLAVADAFDAMTSDRPYRRALHAKTRSPRSGAVPARSSTRRSSRVSSKRSREDELPVAAAS